MSSYLDNIKTFRTYLISMNLLEDNYDYYLFNNMNYGKTDLAQQIMRVFGWPSFKYLFYKNKTIYYGLDDQFLNKHKIPLYLQSKMYPRQGTYIATNVPLISQVQDKEISWIMDREIFLPKYINPFPMQPCENVLDVMDINHGGFRYSEGCTFKAYDFGIGVCNDSLRSVCKYLVGKIYINVFVDLFTHPSLNSTYDTKIIVDDNFNIEIIHFHDPNPAKRCNVTVRYRNNIYNFIIYESDIFVDTNDTGTPYYYDDIDTLRYYNDYVSSVGDLKGFYTLDTNEKNNISSNTTSKSNITPEEAKTALNKLDNIKTSCSDETSDSNDLGNSETIGNLIIFTLLILPILIVLGFVLKFTPIGYLSIILTGAFIALIM